jgi:hypothetical protein
MKHPSSPLRPVRLTLAAFLHHIFPHETETPVPPLVLPVGRALTSGIFFLGIHCGGKWTPNRGFGFP